MHAVLNAQERLRLLGEYLLETFEERDSQPLLFDLFRVDRRRKLKRIPGMDGKGVTLHNVAYFHAHSNDGFQLYKSIEHRADVAGHKFSYTDRNAFLISIETGAGKNAGGMSQ